MARGAAKGIFFPKYREYHDISGKMLCGGQPLIIDDYLVPGIWWRGKG
jgi:hypothetical protein